MINDMADNFIPAHDQPFLVADVAYFLSQAIYCLANENKSSISPEEKKKAGEEAIPLARKAVAMYTKLHGTDNFRFANALGVLAQALNFFNNLDDDDEVTRLYQQAIDITLRGEGNLSCNLAIDEHRLGEVYNKRAISACNACMSFVSTGMMDQAAIQLDRCKINFDLALPHFKEALRVYRAIDREERAASSLHRVTEIEENLRKIPIVAAENGIQRL